MLETVNDLITHKKVPALGPVLKLALLQYVSTLNNDSMGTRIGEIVYRHDRDCPETMELFLTNTLPVAHRPMASAQEVN